MRVGVNIGSFNERKFTTMSDPKKVMQMIKENEVKYVDLRFTDPRGNVMLMAGAFWMACGIFVMKNMINFDF